MVGVDIGTTSTKAVVYTEAGAVVAHHAVAYPLLRPARDAAEQAPEEIFTAVVASIRMAIVGAGEAAGREVVCVGFSAAMHSLIAVDDRGGLLTRSITWADNRAAAWAERIRATDVATALYRRTGTPIHPMSPLVKLAWLRDAQPDVFNRAARFVGIKEASAPAPESRPPAASPAPLSGGR